ncbi:elongation factor 1-beta isoform X1 [Podarcis raffonei]|uniref:elongation factor 1-beta isoform X1 n=1 Tax=Podarcis raffonei TaxID=65483 RepID=UPI0023299A3C|nr:elongation factor 1-beta isoform X1 [Podarcis raffonei]
MGFGDLKSASGLQLLNAFLASRSYIEGYVPSQADIAVFEAVGAPPPPELFHALRWYNHIKSFDKQKARSLVGEVTSNPLQYLCQENSMDNNIRHIKVMTLEDKPLRSEGVQHATKEERRTRTSRSRADKAGGTKPKGHSVVDVPGSEKKAERLKGKYCIGTWNVRSMDHSKLDVVKQEMARINIDILGISELKWTGVGEFSSDDHHIYYCGQESHRINGVALIVNKRVARLILGYNLKNDRMISIRFQGRPLHTTVIQVYAPATDAEETEIDQFYEDLQCLLKLTPKKDVLLIMGDWNAKVGNQEIKGTTGKFGLGVQDEAGQRLIEFCQENKLVITNTLFEQHRRRLYTWKSADGQHRDQIDYILCSQRWRSSIESAKTRPGADCGSDHQLLIAQFKLKLKAGKTTGPVRYNLNQIPYEYTVEARNGFKDSDLVDRVPEEKWMEARNIIQEVATKTIPMKRKCNKAKWLSNEALQIARERRQAKCEGDRERYRKLNADFQRMARRDKRAFLNDLPGVKKALGKYGPSDVEDSTGTGGDSKDDDDIDLFGSDEEEESEEAKRLREERLAQYESKKSKKPALVAKSSLLLDVKPWDDETDMGKLEECVRSIQADGLVWGSSKLVPVGYGIKKLQIQCVVEDDKVGTDMLEERITAFEDYVQSMDVAAFNKI